jgi:hypothetical protein
VSQRSEQAHDRRVTENLEKEFGLTRNTFPNKEEVQAIKALYAEQSKRRPLPEDILDIMDRGCQLRPRLGVTILEEIIENLQALKKRIE